MMSARKDVTNYVPKCRRCKRLDGAPFKSKQAAQLPPFRVSPSHPFTNTGVDYAGPYLVKPIHDDANVNMFNVHIVLYTCAATRAVHLDVVPDVGASSFFRSLKIFISRRGVPNLMISENASCFIKNEEVKLSEEMGTLGIKWKFIVEASPWWRGGGARLIKSMKRSLNRVIFRSSVNYEELLTIVIEIEGIMNSRPLPYINSDIEEILTPGILLMGKRILNQNVNELSEESNDKPQITR